MQTLFSSIVVMALAASITSRTGECVCVCVVVLIVVQRVVRALAKLTSATRRRRHPTAAPISITSDRLFVRRRRRRHPRATFDRSNRTQRITRSHHQQQQQQRR